MKSRCVLFCIPTFGGGGAERQLSALAPALVEVGFKVHIAYWGEGPNFRKLAESGVHLHRISVTSGYNPLLFVELFALILKLRPAVIHTWLTQMDVLAGSIAVLLRIPFVLSERSSALAYAPTLRNYLRRLVGGFAHKIVANSKGGVAYWVNRVPCERLLLIPNAIVLGSSDIDCRAEDILGWAGSRKLLVFGGRLTESKNLRVLIDAIAALNTYSGIDDLALIVFGDGPLMSDIRSDIVARGLGGRICLGGYTDSLSFWLGRADVFISLSRYEGQPNAVIEAASLGIPLILSDIEGHRELFDEKAVWFVGCDDPLEVGAAIRDVMESRSESRARGALAKAQVSHLTVQGAISRYELLYDSLEK